VKDEAAVRDRFWGNVDRLGPMHVGLGTRCWVWTRWCVPSGHGRFWRGIGATVFAHRTAYEFAVGRIPEGMVCRHRCDNPPCVNPDHLELGSQADNVRDCLKRGRARSAYGDSRSNVKLTAVQVMVMRVDYAAGGTTYAELAGQYGVSKSVVAGVLRGITWRHLL